MKLKLQIPVFVDLAWEAHRSPLVAAITCLRFLVFIYVNFLLGVVYGVVNPTSCGAIRGESSSAQDASEIMYFFAVVLAALASCRAQSRVWLGPAFLLMFIYAGLSISLQMPSCTALINANVGDENGITTVILAVFDLVFTLLTLIGLLWCIIEDPPALLGRETFADTPSASTSRVRAAVERARAFAVPAGSAFAGWFKDVCRGIIVAPIRHHLAVLISIVFCITVTIVISILSGKAREFEEKEWSQFLDFFNGLIQQYVDLPSELGPIQDLLPAIQSFYYAAGDVINFASDSINNYGLWVLVVVYDALFAASIGASIACVLVVFSISSSYVAFWQDSDRIAKHLAPAVVGGSSNEVAPRTWELGGSNKEGGAVSVPLLSSVSTSSAEPEMYQQQPPSSSAQQSASPISSQNCLLRCISRAPVYCADGMTLDLAGAAFTFQNASQYSALYIINLVTVFLLMTVILTALVFFFSADSTRSYAWGVVGTFIGSFIYQYIVSRIYSRCIASGTQIFHPKVLLTFDFLSTTTLGASLGVTSGITRFVIGILRLLFQMTMLNRSLLPGSLATLDSGFLAYGGIMKAAWAWELDPATAPK